MKRYNLKFNLSNLDTVMMIDAKYLCYRSQYSKNVSKLSYGMTKTGLYYGFFNTIRSLITKFQPINSIMFWDGVGSIRRQEYPGYKNRDNLKYLKPEQIETLEMINDEYPHIVALCASLGFAGYILDDYEADDLMALFTKRFIDINKIIITRDEDIYQLIDQTTFIYDPDRKLKKDYQWFKREYDIEPEQWKYVKSMSGCKSDTVPGIPNVGLKTAIKIIKGDKKANEKLIGHEKEIKLWERLTHLPHPNLNEVKIPYKITHLNLDMFLDMCQQFNFRSFLEKIHEFKLLM